MLPFLYNLPNTSRRHIHLLRKAFTCTQGITYNESRFIDPFERLLSLKVVANCLFGPECTEKQTCPPFMGGIYLNHLTTLSPFIVSHDQTGQIKGLDILCNARMIEDLVSFTNKHSILVIFQPSMQRNNLTLFTGNLYIQPQRLSIVVVCSEVRLNVKMTVNHIHTTIFFHVISSLRLNLLMVIHQVVCQTRVATIHHVLFSVQPPNIWVEFAGLCKLIISSSAANQTLFGQYDRRFWYLK